MVCSLSGYVGGLSVNILLKTSSNTQYTCMVYFLSVYVGGLLDCYSVQTSLDTQCTCMACLLNGCVDVQPEKCDLKSPSNSLYTYKVCILSVYAGVKLDCSLL